MKEYSIRNFLLVFFILLSACSSAPYIAEYPDKFTATGNNAIYIANHGWHTGFIIPATGIQKNLPKLQERFPNVPYIEFGWGDKGFYQANEITSGLTLRAIFWPTESVIHAVAVPARPDKYFSGSDVEKICLNDNELSSLITFISNSFFQNNSGEVLELKNGLYGNSQFYKGVGDYYLMNTCNKWTAKGLKSIGMDISPTFKLTAESVMSYLKHINPALTIMDNDPLASRSSRLACH